jgi:hypothetical protein
MELFDLPCVLRDDTSVAQAVQVMQETDRRALLVWRRIHEYWLYLNSDIAHAVSSRIRFLRDLTCPDPPEQRIRPITGSWPEIEWDPRIGLPVLGPPIQRLIQTELDRAERRYGILVAPDPPPPIEYGVSRALVASQEERHAQRIINAPKECVCSGPQGHMSQSPPKQQDEPCNLCAGNFDCF